MKMGPTKSSQIRSCGTNWIASTISLRNKKKAHPENARRSVVGLALEKPNSLSRRCYHSSGAQAHLAPRAHRAQIATLSPSSSVSWSLEPTRSDGAHPDSAPMATHNPRRMSRSTRFFRTRRRALRRPMRRRTGRKLLPAGAVGAARSGTAPCWRGQRCCHMSRLTAPRCSGGALGAQAARS